MCEQFVIVSKRVQIERERKKHDEETHGRVKGHSKLIILITDAKGHKHYP